MSSKITLYDASGNPVELSGDELKELLNIQDPIGVNQTWQDVTSERALDTEYVNDTGRPICVRASARFTDDWCRVNITVDGMEILSAYNTINTNGNFGDMVSLIVPAGSTYKVITSPTNSTLDKWYELR